MLWEMVKLKDLDIPREYQSRELDGDVLEIQIHGRVTDSRDCTKLNRNLVKAFQKKQSTENEALIENSRNLRSWMRFTRLQKIPDH